MEIKQNLTNVNYTPNGIKEIRGIVLHSMWGTQNGSIQWFKNPEAKASAHYCISQDGEIVQCVLDKDMAWHAGVYDEPIPDYLRPNPNFYTLGIELEDRRDSNWPYPEAQRKAVKWLVKILQDKYAIPKSKVLMHKTLNPSRRSDPVGDFSFDWLFDVEEPEVPDTQKQKQQIINDVYKALVGRDTSASEMAWRLEQGLNTVELIQDIVKGDGGYHALWVKPMLEAQKLELESAYTTALSARDTYWQGQVASAKELKADEIAKTIETARPSIIATASTSELFSALLNKIFSKTVEAQPQNETKKGVDNS